MIQNNYSVFNITIKLNKAWLHDAWLQVCKRIGKKKDGKFAYKADLCSVIRVTKAFKSITNYNMYIIILCNEQKLLFKLLYKKWFEWLDDKLI